MFQVHRRLLYDDGRGVREPLNEPGINGKGLIIRGKHLLILDTVDNSAYTQRMMAEELMMIPELSFTQNEGIQLEDYNLKVIIIIIIYNHFFTCSIVDYLLLFLIMYTC